MMLRVRSPRHEPRDIDLGPALGRLSGRREAFDLLRQRMDVALTEPRRVPITVYMEQPSR